VEVALGALGLSQIEPPGDLLDRESCFSWHRDTPLASCAAWTECWTCRARKSTVNRRAFYGLTRRLTESWPDRIIEDWHPSVAFRMILSRHNSVSLSAQQEASGVAACLHARSPKTAGCEKQQKTPANKGHFPIHLGPLPDQCRTGSQATRLQVSSLFTQQCQVAPRWWMPSLSNMENPCQHAPGVSKVRTLA
jgi:hypothetical protein